MAKSGKDGGKKTDSMSNIGHGQIPFRESGLTPMAVSFRRITQVSTCSFAQLRRVKLGDGCSRSRTPRLGLFWRLLVCTPIIWPLGGDLRYVPERIWFPTECRHGCIEDLRSLGWGTPKGFSTALSARPTRLGFHSTVGDARRGFSTPTRG